VLSAWRAANMIDRHRRRGGVKPGGGHHSPRLQTSSPSGSNGDQWVQLRSARPLSLLTESRWV